MNAILAAACEIERFFRARRWKFCIIGGLAVARWGNPRATEDVDVSLMTGLGSERRVIDRILQDFEPRTSDAADFGVQSRVLLIKACNGTNIDVALAAFPFEEEIIRRASRFEFEKGIRLTTASAEGCVVMKSIAGRRATGRTSPILPVASEINSIGNTSNGSLKDFPKSSIPQNFSNGCASIERL